MKLDYKIVPVFFLIIIAVCINIFQGNEESSICSEYKRELLKEYKGRIVKKYRDTDNHNRPIIIVEYDSLHEEIDLSWYKSDIYTYLNVGDSILKQINNNNLIVSRNGIDSVLIRESKCN